MKRQPRPRHLASRSQRPLREDEGESSYMKHYRVRCSWRRGSLPNEIAAVPWLPLPHNSP